MDVAKKSSSVSHKLLRVMLQQLLFVLNLWHGIQKMLQGGAYWAKQEALPSFPVVPTACLFTAYRLFADRLLFRSV